MAANMNKFYKAIGEVVRMAARYLRIGDNRTNEVMEELEMMTAGVGLTDVEVQLPVEAVMRTDLRERLPCMVDRAGMKEVLRYVIETPDEGGSTDIMLEVWKITRNMHVMVREVGQLHAVSIKWGLFNISLNIIAVKTGECEEAGCPVTISTGDGIAFLVRQFDFATFRVFFFEEEEISAGQRLLFMTILDADRFSHITVEDFAQWEAGMVLDELELWSAGANYRRFSAEEAGLVPVGKDWEGENLLEEEKTIIGLENEVMDERLDEEFIEGTEEEAGEDLGQSPDLMSSKGEKTKAEVRAEKEKEEAEKNQAEEPESLRTDEEEAEDDLIDAIEFSGLNRFGERVVLTTDQMMGVRSLCIGGVDPNKSKDKVEKESKEFDPVSFLRSIQESDPEARLVKVRKSVHQPWIEEEKRERAKAANKNMVAARGSEVMDSEEEEERSISGREMWSEEEEDDDCEDWDTEIMPDISVSTDVEGGSQASFLTDETSSSVRSPRAELSMYTPDKKISNNDQEKDDVSPGSPAPKRRKLMGWTDEEEKLEVTPAERSVIWSPVLAKIEDGRPTVTVSSSSEESDEAFMKRVEEERREERAARSRLDLEVPEGMRQVRFRSGRTTVIPDNDVVEQVFHEVFNAEDSEDDEGEEED